MSYKDLIHTLDIKSAQFTVTGVDNQDTIVSGISVALYDQTGKAFNHCLDYPTAYRLYKAFHQHLQSAQIIH